MIQATNFAVDPGWKILLKDMGASEDEVMRRAELTLDLFSRKNAALTAKEYFVIQRARQPAADHEIRQIGPKINVDNKASLRYLGD